MVMARTSPLAVWKDSEENADIFVKRLTDLLAAEYGATVVDSVHEMDVLSEYCFADRVVLDDDIRRLHDTITLMIREVKYRWTDDTPVAMLGVAGTLRGNPDRFAFKLAVGAVGRRCRP